MLRPILFALLALALAAPAQADGPPPEGSGVQRPRHHLRGAVHRTLHRPYRIARFQVEPPMGPAYYAWPEPAEVRMPIYNRPTHLPGYW